MAQSNRPLTKRATTEAQESEPSTDRRSHRLLRLPSSHPMGIVDEEVRCCRRAGLDHDELGTDLQREAAESFVKDWNEMLASIASKNAAFKTAG